MAPGQRQVAAREPDLAARLHGVDAPDHCGRAVRQVGAGRRGTVAFALNRHHVKSVHLHLRKYEELHLQRFPAVRKMQPITFNYSTFLRWLHGKEQEHL